MKKITLIAYAVLSAALTLAITSCKSAGTVAATAPDTASPTEAAIFQVSDDGFVTNCITEVNVAMPTNSAFLRASAEKPVEVKPFAISISELTYDKWHKVRTWAVTNGYTFANAGREGNAGVDGAAPKDTVLPVTKISWRDAVVWCNAASEMEGLKPVYLNNGEVIKVSQAGNSFGEKDGTAAGDGIADAAVVDETADGYRLPTWQEWEFAARGGNPASEEWMYVYAGTNNDVNAVAWNKENSSGSTQNIKSKKANSYTLFDMSGNVWEWCFDAGVPSKMKRNIVGGSYKYPAEKCAIVSVDKAPVTNSYEDLGFRLVKNIPTK